MIAMLNTYLTQLQNAASAAGVNLADACKREGIARTTLQRWRNGETTPNEATAKALLGRIETMRSETESGAAA